MQWELADFNCHPIDGEASQLEACATHLGTIAGDIRSQIEQLRAVNTGDIWESAHGAHEGFQDVIDDLPEKLDLVAGRYEAIAEALSTFHPVLASTKDDAEFNIQRAAEAQLEVERAEAGVQAMEEHEERARRDADTRNENLEPGESPVDPEPWTDTDYRAELAEAESELRAHIQAVRDAVTTFHRAAEACEDALYEAGNDDLKNDSGIGASIGRALSSFKDLVVDAVDVLVDILEWVAIAIAVVIIIIAITSGIGAVPGALLLAAFYTNAAILGGSIISAAGGGNQDWGDVGWAAVNTIASGAGALGHYSELGTLGRLAPLGRLATTPAGQVMGSLEVGTVLTLRDIDDKLDRGIFDPSSLPVGLSTLGGLSEAIRPVPMVTSNIHVPAFSFLESSDHTTITMDLPTPTPPDAITVSVPSLPVAP